MKNTIMTPPFFGSILRMLSGALRPVSAVARGEECEKMIGCDLLENRIRLQLTWKLHLEQLMQKDDLRFRQ